MDQPRVTEAAPATGPEQEAEVITLAHPVDLGSGRSLTELRVQRAHLTVGDEIKAQEGTLNLGEIEVRLAALVFKVNPEDLKLIHRADWRTQVAPVLARFF